MGWAGCSIRARLFFLLPAGAVATRLILCMNNLPKERRPVRRLRKTLQRERDQAAALRESDSDSVEGGVVGGEAYATKEPCHPIKAVSWAARSKRGRAWISRILRGGRGIVLRYRGAGWVCLGLWIGVRVARPPSIDVTRQAFCDWHEVGPYPSTSPPGTPLD